MFAIARIISVAVTLPGNSARMVRITLKNTFVHTMVCSAGKLYFTVRHYVSCFCSGN